MPLPTRRDYYRQRSSGTAGAYSVTFARPAGALEGDMLIVHMCIGNGGPTIAALNGWTQIRFGSVNTRAIATFARRYDEDDPATYNIDFSLPAACGIELGVMAIGDAGDVGNWTIGTSWRRQDNGGTIATTQAPSITAPSDSLVMAFEIEATNAAETNGSESISGATKWFGSPDQTTNAVNIERVLVSFIEMEGGGTTPTIITTWPSAAANGASYQVAIPYNETGVVSTIYAVDGFERTIASGSWGAAETGGNWTSSGSGTSLSVAGGKGIITLPGSGSSGGARLNGVVHDDIELYAEWSTDKIPIGSNTRPRFITRYMSGVGDYHVRASVTPAAVADFRWYRDDTAALGSTVSLPTAYTPGAVLKIRAQTYPDGAGITRLRARMWYATDAEPTTWGINITDATPAWQVAGAIGINAGFGTGATNGPVTVSIDNLLATVRQPDITATTGNIGLHVVPHFTQTSFRVGAKFSNSQLPNIVRLYNASSTLIDTKTPTISASKWGTAEFTGLTADTQYTVKFIVNGIEQTDATLTIKTLPNAKTSFVVVGGSCQFTGSTHPVFTSIKNDHPLFIAHMGDLQYQNATDELAWRTAVESSLGSLTMRPMLETVPISWTWDNHDRIIVDTLNLGSTDQATATYWKEIAGASGWSSSSTMGRTWTVGRVRFIQTDQWTVRDDPDLVVEPRTFLGVTQKQWWKDALLASEEPIIVWFCQWTAQSNANGRWNSFDAETTELENWLNAHPSVKERLIMVGGDSHVLQADSGRRTRAQGSRFSGVPSLNVSGFNRSSTGANGGNWDIAEGDIRTSVQAESDWGAYSRLTFNDDGRTITMLWEAVQVSLGGAVTILASWTRKTGTVMIGNKMAITQYYRSDQSRIQPLSIDLPS